MPEISRTDVDVSSTQTLTGKIYIPARESTATSAATKTLTIASPQVQVFTGSTTHTLRLPTTGVTAGQSYTIVNNSSGVVTVQSSAGNTILAGQTGPSITTVYTARKDTPTAAADWAVTGLTIGNAAYQTLVRDDSGWVRSGGFRPDPTSTATAGGTTTLNNTFTQTQIFTGSANQTVVLPNQYVNGRQWTVVNSSTGTVTVNASGGATVATLPASTSATFLALIDSPTLATNFQASVVQPSGALAGVRVAVPASAAATGVVGQWAAESGWLYICTAANTWQRAAIATWP